MFLERDPCAAAIPLAASPSQLLCASPAGGRYGEEREAAFRSAGLAVAVHLAILPILMTLGYHAAAKPDDHLVAVNLSPPPPPQTAQRTRPRPQKLEARIAPTTTPSSAPAMQSKTVAIAMAMVPQQPATLDVPPAPPLPSAPSALPSTVTSDSLGTRMLAGRPPRYPVESRRRKEQGTVQLLLILGANGAVEAISVARSSGFDRLDAAALAAVRGWRWQPTLREGVPVKVTGLVEIPFVLKTN